MHSCLFPKSVALKKTAVSLAAIALSGCNTLQAQSRVDPQTIAIYPAGRSHTNVSCVEPIDGDNRQGAINLDCLRFPVKGEGEGPLAYLLAAEHQTARNRLASILLKHSDDVCTVELGRLTANEAMANTALSVATTAFSTASSIVTGELAKSILSGVATTTNASRDHLNAEVYRNVLSTAVSKAIQLERDRMRTELLGRFSSLSADYNVDQMIMDVNRYHQVCSFYRGLGLVIAAVDRTRYDKSDQRRSLGIAIQDLDAKAQSINASLARKTTSPEDREALNAQLAEVRRIQTEMIKQRAGVTSTTEGADPDPDPPKE